MFKSYFKIAWRNITRHKVSSLINILGLAIGICSFIVIFLISYYEFSFDNFHPDKERIYRIVGDLKTASGEDIDQNRAPYLLQLSLQKEIPGIDKIAAFYPINAKIVVQNAQGQIRKFEGGSEDGNWWTSVIVANQNYLNIFKYDWLAGNEGTSLDQRFNVVLTENRARQYFGNMPPDKILGKEIIYNDSIRVRVSGIVKEWNRNTDFPFTDIISISALYQPGELKNTAPWTFVKLSKGTTASFINTKLGQFVKKYFSEDPLLKRSMYLQPLADMHFNSHFYEDGFRKAHLPTIYGLIAIATFILIIAMINFINLSTAQSIGRAKEMGIRKVLGSKRSNLIFQFIVETFIQTFVATSLAALTAKPVLTIFHDYIPPGIKFSPVYPSTILFLFSLALITALLSGLYPAKVLSSYAPVLSLKGIGLTRANDKMTLRKGLIVFQFTLSLIFIIAVIVIKTQLHFIRNKDLGYNTDAIITIKTPWSDSLSKVNILAGKMRQWPAVQKLALEAFPPIGPVGNLLDIQYKGKREVSLMVGMDEGNENFIPVYQMKLLAGRNLVPGDSLNELVLNESLSRRLGFTYPGDAIGQLIYSGHKMIPIVGVVADYHTKTLHEMIMPVCIGDIPEDQREIVIKLSTKGKQFNQLKETIANFYKTWNEVYPGISFEYSFLDESIASMYTKEQKTSTLMNLAMVMAIFISCMGLFGLILFSTERRTKEIGIRKVLGASVRGIVFLLSKDFLKLVCVAMLIASPVVYYLMNVWLQGYAYRIQITWWMFMLAWLSALFFAFLAISVLAIKSAMANPARSLRTE